MYMTCSSFFAKPEGSALYGETAATTQQLDDACEVLLRGRWAENRRIVGIRPSFVNPFLPKPVGTLKSCLYLTPSYNRQLEFWSAPIFPFWDLRKQLYR
jgi:hypothetical protein